MEELIAILMDLLMLKQNLVQFMELGENGATGKHVLPSCGAVDTQIRKRP